MRSKRRAIHHIKNIPWKLLVLGQMKYSQSLHRPSMIFSRLLDKTLRNLKGHIESYKTRLFGSLSLGHWPPEVAVPLPQPHHTARSSALSDTPSRQERASSAAGRLHKKIPVSNRGLSWHNMYYPSALPCERFSETVFNCCGDNQLCLW